MKHIADLFGLGNGKDCLIIGGGTSLAEFDFTQDLEDIYVISINQHYNQLADMIVYYDRKMQKYFRNPDHVPDDVLLVGFRHNHIDYTVERCTHYHDYKDIVFGDSGFHCLQFADRIFGFNNIYLLGYDYYTGDTTYHYNESQSDETAMNRFKTWSIAEVLPKYNNIEWVNSIYNCSHESALRLFPYKLPYQK